MEVALVTVGDELLAGDTVNTNATWLATQLHDRGVTVTRVLTVPDDRDAIAENVRTYSDAFDAVIVTGGLGGTPDDITMDAVAAAFDRELAVDDLALADVEETLEAIADTYPDLSVDPEAEATLPAGGRPLLNRAGLSPGCVVENVYVLPGIPDEMQSMFESVADEFEGDTMAEFLYTPQPEANLIEPLTDVGMKFDVSVGCYPDRDENHNRLKVSGEDRDQIDGALDWLRDRLDVYDDPEDATRE
ncbi:competence/damage-inducible protein A [Halorientalis marina]|jgi:molybdenum cofactor synthesis domain-containing protein|uniref:competence/damage-inducible protein A n=1 Tax=Halorientalis marina TaxID=2931976 RepID=UPI001FF36EBA|nr:competence/damage-inducible protein A [Halorientalis marina]